MSNAYAYNETRETFLATELAIADSHWTRLKGLLGRRPDNFGPGKGLWIVPCHGVHTLAMTFPIDVIFLDEYRVVVHLEQHVRPWRITPMRLEAATVIELPSETIARTETRIGDHVEIKGFWA
jgi:uncharacterized membrane protein (UPF0127 family)